MRKPLIAALMFAASAAGTVAVPAAAQNNSQGLVTVNVQDVTILQNFLNNAQIAALNNLNVPITVQAPISVAANVCGTTVALLADARKAGDAACTATSGSRALADIVNRQLLSQNR
ncbi:hypothetical protein ACFQPG_12155 [Sphingomonas sp. GCM10030256]|uniref:hypothetical protein n=1 Tax=Sphingomonas sp. GCM10030256 TaxID=3273427 RepID=UPI003618053E